MRRTTTPPARPDPTARRAQRDHREDFDGFNTVEENLQALCCRHHHIKTETTWRSERAFDGTIIWTSPTGRIYEKPPDDLPGYEDTWRDQPNDDSTPDPPDESDYSDPSHEDDGSDPLQ